MSKYKFSKPLEAYLEVTGIKNRVIANMKTQSKIPGAHDITISALFHWSSTFEGWGFWYRHSEDFHYFKQRIYYA